jgi:hypothetical protein
VGQRRWSKRARRREEEGGGRREEGGGRREEEGGRKPKEEGGGRREGGGRGEEGWEGEEGNLEHSIRVRGHEAVTRDNNLFQMFFVSVQESIVHEPEGIYF